MDIEYIKQLIDLMEERSLAQLEVQNEQKKVHITRQISVNTVNSLPTDHPTHLISKTAPPALVETSPMVGVFYTSPEPNAPPFVTIGQQVQVGDVLGIVEAMKIMNRIEATKNGVVAEILVANGDVVQFEQPILRYQT